MFTRDWNISKQLTRWLVARRVSPNAISLAGMAGGIVAGLALAATTTARTGVHDVSGRRGRHHCARHGQPAGRHGGGGKRQSLAVGELFNEVPDRVADIAILIGAGYAAGGNATLGLLAALVAVLVAYVRAEGKVVGASQQYCGPMAKPERMVIILLTALYCGLTPAAWQPAFRSGEHSFGLMAIGLAIIVAGES